LTTGSSGSVGTLRVCWVSRAPPWLSYGVLVDGTEHGRIGSGKVAVMHVPAGPHNVVVRHWSYATKPFEVVVEAGATVDLYAGTRTLPHWMGYRESMRWGREHSLWLTDNMIAPPTSPPTVARPVPVYKWVLQGLAIVFFGTLAVLSGARGHYLKMTFDLAFVAAGIAILLRWGSLRRRQKRNEGAPENPASGP
jgi:hypothetical protein